MKYRRNLSITLSLCGLALLISQSAILAQDSIEVRTHECYWVNPWYIGPDTTYNPSTHTFQTRYNPILKIWVINNQGKVDYVRRMTIRYEGDDLSDVEEVLIWREAHNLLYPQPDPWDTTYSFYPATRSDSLCAVTDFDLSGYAFFDFVIEGPNDSIRFEIAANDSILFYAVLILAQGLPASHTDNVLDVMIPQDSVITQNGFNAPASNSGQGRTYRVLLDATPPNLTEEDIHINVWGDSAVVKLGVVFTDSIVNVTDNVTGAIPQSIDDILVFADIRSLNQGTAYADKRLIRVHPTSDDFTYCDSIRHEHKQGYGIDIQAYERLSGTETPGTYIQKVTAWDEFGNSDSVWDLENPKPMDTIWPDSNLVEWSIHYDDNSDGTAAIGDSLKIKIDMSNQPPSGDPDEIMNRDVYHTLFPRNGVYFAHHYDFRGFDPSGMNCTYPFEFSDTDGNEVWELVFEAKQGYWDVDSGDADAYVYVTAEDNANYWPGSTYPSIDHIGPGNLRRWKSDLFPFGVDTKLPYPVYEFSAYVSADKRIHLSWRDSTDDNDKGHYYIYWNNGTGGIAGIDTANHCALVTAPESSWTSEPLTFGLTYCFLVRNMDDAGNMERNFYNIVSQHISDLGAADTVCFLAGPPCSTDGDTLYFPPWSNDIKIYINMWNDQGLVYVNVPLTDLTYGPPSYAFLDSLKNNGSANPLCFQGSRLEHFDVKGLYLTLHPPKVMYSALVFDEADSLLSGYGLLATMIYTVSDTGRICIDSCFVPPSNVLMFVRPPAIGFTPQFVSKCFRLEPCHCGDASGEGPVDIVDVVYLINYLFKSGSAPLCPGDVNCDGGTDIVDVVYLINYLFKSGPPPCDPDGNGVPDC